MVDCKEGGWDGGGVQGCFCTSLKTNAGSVAVRELENL